MANYNIDFSLLSIDQIDEAAKYLDDQRSGLGFELTYEIALLVDRLEQNPRIYQEVTEGIRRGLLGKFNYMVFYQVVGSTVEVIRVEHGSSKPRFK